jgi:uncharacterized protein (DUF1697 family)
MARLVAFLGGLNVGKAHRVAMADLRDEFERLGYDDVSTVINSGNVLFTTHGSPKRLVPVIEDALATRFGFGVPTFVRTAKQVDTLLAGAPFEPGGEQATVLVGFLTKAPTAAAKQAVADAAASSDVDTVVLAGPHLWWRVAGGQMASKLKPKQLAPLGPMTTRNITMLRNLATKL